MTGNFIFHSVGQGLFYTGVIIDEKCEPFFFVYDCGSSAYYKHNLDNWIATINSFPMINEIDLLVISHFDYDHISGIVSLIRGKKVKKIVMPYYDSNQLNYLKLIYYENTTQNEIDDMYISFLSNPLEFFARLETQVILMGGDNNLERSIGNYQEKIYEYSEKNCLGNKLYYSIYNWEFFFYNKKPRNTKRMKDYLSAIQALIYKFGSLENVIKREDELRNLKALEPFKKSNSNSVVLYHGPIDRASLSQCFCKSRFDSYEYCFDCFNPHYCCSCCSCKETGTLLTGDLECLKTEMKNIKLFIGGKRYRNICVFLVPHHGGRSSFKDYDREYNVISYGLKNSFDHPNSFTLKKIATKGNQICLVNENEFFRYSISIYH